MKSVGKVISLLLVIAMVGAMICMSAKLGATTPILEDGLVAYYPFNGNANDESGNENHGTVQGANLTEDRFGNANSAYSFDGVDDYIEVTDDDTLDLSDGLTISAWIESSDTSGARDIVSKWGTGLKRSYIFKDHNVSDKLRIELSKGGLSILADLEGTTSMIVGEWIHVCATYDSNTVKLYFNGTQDAASPASGIIAIGDAPLIIGAVCEDLQFREFFSGILDDIRIYNRALSAEEIQELYHEGLPPSSEVWVDDDYCDGCPNNGHTWGYDAFAKIQDGIDAVGGSIVHVGPGTYYENIILKDGVQLLGAGEDVTTIDGGGEGSVVTAISVGSDTVLDGFAITNGSADSGGGMYMEDSSPTVSSCTFSTNWAWFGGGMYNSNSSPTVTNCIFTANWVAGNGGGMYNSNSSPTVTHCAFSANLYGGGISNWDSSPMVTNCTFSANSATYGGGISSWDSSPVVTNCTFTGNSATWGGGIRNGRSLAMVTNCIFSANLALYGGGMENWKSSAPTVTNCIFYGNSATYGGGMSNYKSSPTLTNCTFSNNLANQGGGMYNWLSSSARVNNCILWGNSGEIYNDNSTPLVTYSDIQGGYSGAGNIDADSLFVDPAGGDYHLQAGSPCIDAGTNEGAPSDDMEGNPRPIDGDGDDTAITDMGAYEYTPPTEPAIEATVDFDPDTLNLKSKGKVVTVYIELPESYDVEEIDITTVMVNGVVPALANPTEVGDHDSDGVPDLMVKFDRAAVQSILEPGDEVEVRVSGELTDGTPFEGVDEIIVTGIPKTPTDPSPIRNATEGSLDTTLSWTGDDFGSVTYNVYFGTDINPPLVSERQSETTYTPTLEADTTYYWRVVAINEHSISSTGSVWSFTTGEAILPSLCFIATAAYGTPIAEEIEILRGFRDEYLLTNPVGQALVDLYYRVSPPMADFISRHEVLRTVVREGFLDPLVAIVRCSQSLWDK